MQGRHAPGLRGRRTSSRPWSWPYSWRWYQDRIGVERDPAEALTWYHRVAALGYAYAQRNLGHIDRFGIGVDPDPAESRRWYEAAAEQGDSNARRALAEL